jgi:hypothetical protein
VPGTIRQSPLLNEPRAAEIDDATNDSLAADAASKVEDRLSGPHDLDARGAAASAAAQTTAAHNDSATDSQLQVMIDGWE